MNIMTKKCDACGTRCESDGVEYHKHALLETPDGQRREICAACTAKLLNP
jgi:hypothetical protein